MMTWRHLNVFQHRCEITCRLPRGKCRQCGHVFRVRPPWEGLSTHFTKEFEAFALLLMRDIDRDDRAANAIIYIESLENQVMDLTMKLQSMTQPVSSDESQNLKTK